MDAKGPYTQHILSAIPSRPHLQPLNEILQQDELGITRFCLVDLTRPSSRIVGETTDVLEARNLIAEQSDAPNQAPAQSQPRFRICVIENISPAFVELIGSAWDLDMEFFVDHAMGCRGDFARVPPNLASISNTASYFSLDGVLAYDIRQLEAVLGERVHPLAQYFFCGRGHYFRREHRMRTDGKAVQLNTRTSYYAKRLEEDSWIVVCLLDPPLIPSSASDFHSIVRYPLASPSQRMLDSTASEPSWQDSLYGRFVQSLCTDISLAERCLLDPFAPAVFLYLNSALSWQETIHRMQVTAKRLSFREIMMAPGLQQSTRLHEMRANVFYMQESVRQTLRTLRRFTGSDPPRSLPITATTASTGSSEREKAGKDEASTRDKLHAIAHDFETILDEAIRLESLIVTSFTILMNTLATNEMQLSHRNTELGIEHSRLGIEQSQAGLRQAESIKILSQMAFVYVPLTFAASIFGMDLQELNGSGQHLWVFVVTGAVATGLTVVSLMGLRWCRRRWMERDEVSSSSAASSSWSLSSTMKLEVQLESEWLDANRFLPAMYRIEEICDGDGTCRPVMYSSSSGSISREEKEKQT